MEKTFPHDLATLIIDFADSPAEVWVGRIVVETENGAPPYTLIIEGMGDARYRHATDLDSSGPEWSGHIDDPDTGERVAEILVRRAVEGDAVDAIPFSGGPHVPLPIPVMQGIIQSEGIFTMPTTWAMSEDDGFVTTLMLSTDQGLYVRFSGAWHLLTDEDVVDGLNVVEVEGSALDMFDQFDRAGQLVHLSAMPRKDDGVDVVPAAEQTVQPVTAATLVKERPRLASADDLPAAIAAAADDPDMQWWVERRTKALGLSAEFPWAE